MRSHVAGRKMRRLLERGGCAVDWRRVAICSLIFAVSACTPGVEYGAGQSHKYTGSPVFMMYEEWGTPVSRALFPNGARFYQFRKPNTDCMASAWATDLNIVYRLALSGPDSCAAGS
jgi:hypothetical protein